MIEIAGRTVSSEADFVRVEAESRRIMRDWPESVVGQARRAAAARDGRLLVTLERMAEQGAALNERMLGQSQRSADTARDRVQATEATVWREAYRLVDQGQDVTPLLCQVAAAAWWAGIVH